MQINIKNLIIVSVLSLGLNFALASVGVPALWLFGLSCGMVWLSESLGFPVLSYDEAE